MSVQVKAHIRNGHKVRAYVRGGGVNKKPGKGKYTSMVDDVKNNNPIKHHTPKNNTKLDGSKPSSREVNYYARETRTLSKKEFKALQNKEHFKKYD